VAKGRAMGAPKRTTRIPARGTTLAACDNLLAAAKDQQYVYEGLTHDYSQCPKWRLKQRRSLRDRRFLALVRYMQAVTAAQDLANKRQRIGATTEETW
jgi:hypothetical protein